MSTLASITVNQCDGCEAIATLQSDESYSWFAEKWHDGYVKHFCPECKDKAEHAQAIAEDDAMAADMAAGVKDYLASGKEQAGTPAVQSGRQDAVVPLEAFNGH